jgi:hypothetical protein
MRQPLLTMLVVCAVGGYASQAKAQGNSTMMPGGTVVSNSGGEQLKLVGRDEPQVGRQVGKSVNMPSGNPMLRPYNPNNPYEQLQGTNLSPKSVVAPVNGYTPSAQPSQFTQVVNSLKSIVGLNEKPIILAKTYTPGIYRRDRERVHERMFVRD